jgi:hypothetical protein
LENISTFYQEERDYVFCEIFDFKHSINKEGKIYVKNKDIKREKMFCKNMFPYRVPGLTQHYVMWYSYDIIDETEINNDITYQIQKLIGNNHFDFVWYINPKKHMDNIFHVQVFLTLSN